MKYLRFADTRNLKTTANVFKLLSILCRVFMEKLNKYICEIIFMKFDFFYEIQQTCYTISFHIK